jgi:ribonuclease-3
LNSHSYNPSLQALQNRIGYHFKDSNWLKLALTHRSYASQHNERLEFLGDGLLNFVVADILFAFNQNANEGALSRMRSHLVRQESLARIGNELGLSSLLLLGEGERKSGGNSRPSILADAFEALVGAIYCDSGFESAQTFVRRHIEEILTQNNSFDILGKDAKTQLQEWLQAKRLPLPVYEVVQSGGTTINTVFEVNCTFFTDVACLTNIGSKNVIAKDMQIETCITKGHGTSRRIAEQIAAQAALELLSEKKLLKRHEK